MQVQVNKIAQAMAYKLDGVNFSSDGHVYVSYTLGLLHENGEDVAPSFAPVAAQNYTLTPDVVASMTINAELQDFRSNIYTCIEAKLRELNMLKF